MIIKQPSRTAKNIPESDEIIRELRHRLETSQNFNASLISSIGDGVIIINEYGIITEVNQATLDMLGYKRSDMIDKWFPDLLPSRDKEGNDIPAVDRPTLKSIISGHAETETTSYVKKDGTLFPVSGTASPFMLGGKPRGSIVVFRDVSQEIAVERAKDEFVSLASHQLRTPLTSIKLYTEIIKDDPDNNLNSELQQHLLKIEASTRSMLELVDDFLNISKLELGRLDLKKDDVNLTNLIKTQVDRVAVVASDNKIDIVFNEPSVQTTIKTDFKLLAETVHNLLTNSIRYRSSKNPKVEIGIEEKKNYFVINIKDNGIGIPEEAQANVFDRLYRADNAKTAQANGTGLGLYLVKKIVEALDGKVSLKSKLGQGTTFYIELPK